ncbi:hypothetical protein SAV14893_084320 [Streptomyces avermitilis]|uniref:Uncharacterized protein n=1 Tax=Streptomyces avermitilis TaxID=33903 RepID=A0A4D4MBL5_STRAX|nr:hypothetical protein SAV14893_084320 [Streptomyces avermitilis]GDY70578.1 hypothetical protein SAV31267_000630 [Streptomyces avermitilis]
MAREGLFLKGLSARSRYRPGHELLRCRAGRAEVQGWGSRAKVHERAVPRDRPGLCEQRFPPPLCPLAQVG